MITCPDFITQNLLAIWKKGKTHILRFYLEKDRGGLTNPLGISYNEDIM